VYSRQRGPRGAGFLCVRKAMLERYEPPFIDHFGARWVARDRFELRPDAKRYESWERNYVARLGLGVAADYAMAVGMERIRHRVHLLATRLRDGLTNLPDVTVRDLGRNPSAIVSFTCDTLAPVEIVVAAIAREIEIGASLPESTWLDAERRGLPPLVRVAPRYFNTEAEVDVLLEFFGSLLHTAQG
jgi:cysteine desulfurase/selenocysteine lyase